MAIENPEAVKFCNERIRPAADRFAQLYNFARATIDEFNAKNIAAILPDDANESVVDGSATDGRTPITGQDARRIISRLAEIVAFMDGQAVGTLARKPSILKVAVNPER